MPDDVQPGTQTEVLLVIPPATLDSFPEFVALIQKSASMNTEERQYWIDMLPDMTEDQLSQLRAILVNERDQLASIDATFVAQEEETTEPAGQTTEERLQRARERSEKEQADRSSEQAAVEQALQELE